MNVIHVPSNVNLEKNNFNFLRLLFASMVVIGHCRDLSGFKYPILIIVDTHIAVCGFFIISGFLITKSCLYTRGLKEYFIKRAKRLLPAYFLVIILAAFVLSLFSSLSFREYFFSLGFCKYIVANLMFMNFLCPSLPGVFNGKAINGALWTIKIEVAFYIVIPFIILFLKKLDNLKKRNVFLGAVYISAILYRSVCLYLKNISNSNIIDKLEHQFPGFMQYFAFGIFMLLNYDRIQRHEKKWIVPAIIIFGLHYITKTEFLMPVALGLLVIFVSFHFTQLNNIGKHIDFSYGIYVFHFPIIQLLVSIGVFACNKYIGILLVLGSVFSIAYNRGNFLSANSWVGKKDIRILKNNLGLNRLRVYDDTTMRGKVFMGFIALIMLSHYTRQC
ncbi:MAG: acyltransferase [Bacteroidales bacterium]|jgi:peptidoglycan/LPS O-acetylase OafA/YrhL|nr:acyltransferase [Bacteroidales bacterium]